jgi:hypothetical protein
MPEILGEGYVQILPLTGAPFEAALSAQVTAAMATIEKQFAVAGGGAAAAAGGISALGKETANVAAVAGKAAPAVAAIGKEAKAAAGAVDSAALSLGGFQRQMLAVAKLTPVLIAAFSVKLFGNFEKAAKEATVVFGDSAGEIINFAKTLDTQFGLTSTTALRFAADFGNALVNVGFATDTAAKASEELVKRTADVAAAQGQSTAQISKAFMLAVEGNARGLKQLGIALSATDIANRAAALGFAGTTAELSDSQRAAVFYSLVMEKTSKFVGQAALTSDDFAGRLRTLKAATGDAAIAIGQALAPAVEFIFRVLTDIIKPLNSIPAPLLAFAAAASITAITLNLLSSSALGNFVTGLFSAEGALAVFVGELIAADGVIATTGVVLDAMLGPIGLISLALGAATAIFLVFRQQTESTGDKLSKLGDIAVNTAEKFKQLTGVSISQLTQDLKDLQTVNLGDLNITPTTASIHALAESGRSLGDLQKDVEKVRSTFADLLKLPGTAGIGATKAFLDELANSGLQNTDIYRDLNTQFVTEVNNRRAANLLAQQGSDILDQDSIVRERNAAQIKAQTDAINSLFKIEDQLIAARKTEVTASEAVAAAQQKVNDLRKEGGAAERAAATEKLTTAHDTLTAALERQAIAQKALDDLNAPASERELSDAADAVTEAQIHVAQAIRARDAAEKALHKTTGISLNLAHLSLDQLRTTLANARATLAAQRTSATAVDPAVLQENAVQAEIDLRKAKEAVIDRQKELFDLQNKGKIATDATRGAEHELTLAKNATIKAQDEVNKRQGELDAILAGNTENAKLLLDAQSALQTAIEHQRDAQQTISDLMVTRRDDVDHIFGTEQFITAELQNQINKHKELFLQDANMRRTLVENLLVTSNASFPAGSGAGPLQGAFTDAAIAEIFNAILTGDMAKLIALLKSFGLNIPGHERGALVTAPSLAWIGEKFRPESVIPWSRPDRVWEVLAQSLPHMTPTVRQRLEPVISGSEHRISAPTHLNRPVAEFDYEQMATALAKALREYGLGADVDINVTATPGMSESQLARKMAREMGRYWGNG